MEASFVAIDASESDPSNTREATLVSQIENFRAKST